MPICGKCHREAPQGALFCSFCGGTIKPDGDAESDPLIGTTVASKYFVHQLLGRGGMGDVYKATHITLDRPVVVKLLKKSFLSDPSLVQRFHREARAASRLNHPNSINIIDFGQAEDGTLFMAMEFLSGRSLAAVIAEDWPLSEERIVHMGAQMLSALAEAHALGVIHRDLKPANVMLEPRRDDPDFVKVLDFGIAKLNEPGDSSARLTQAGTVCGTPGYMSPEQVYGEELDARSDLYAVGVILYEMITGLQPFEADTTMGLVTKHLNEPPPPMEVRRPGVNPSPDLANIVMWALQKSRNDRPGSAEEMRAHLLAATIRREGAPRTPIGVPKATMVFDPAQLKPTPARKTPLSQPGLPKAPVPRTPISQPGMSAPAPRTPVSQPGMSAPAPRTPISQPGMKPPPPVGKTPAPRPSPPSTPAPPAAARPAAQKTPSQTFALTEAMAPAPAPAPRTPAPQQPAAPEAPAPRTPTPKTPAARPATPKAAAHAPPAPRSRPAPRSGGDDKREEAAAPRPKASPLQGRLPLVAGGAAAALVLVGLVVWGVTRPKGEPKPETKPESKIAEKVDPRPVEPVPKPIEPAPKPVEPVQPPVAPTPPKPAPVPPAVVSTSPADGAARVPARAPIAVTFSKPMDPAAVAISLDGARVGSLAWTANGTVATLAPGALPPDKNVAVEVAGKDLEGVVLVPVRFSFRTAPAPTVEKPAAAKGIREKKSGVSSIATPPSRTGEGILAVDATPWAVVFVDGERVLETPCSLRLGAGTYRVRAEYLPEFGPREKVVHIVPGKRELWTLSFAR